MNQPDDLARLRAEYEDRERRFADSDLYSWFNPANQFMIQQRQREVLRMLRRHGNTKLSDLSILEMGCGDGGVLVEFSNYGGIPGNMSGVDLLFGRLSKARQRLTGSCLINADGQFLPYTTHSFDLVMQFTALSSILNLEVRQNICCEMIRVLRKSGLIIWYDFWINPTNPQTHGIRLAEIRSLFPGCTYDIQKITLAPPVARRVVPVSWGLALFLESLKIFNSHYLVAIQQV